MDQSDDVVGCPTSSRDALPVSAVETFRLVYIDRCSLRRRHRQDNRFMFRQ